MWFANMKVGVRLGAGFSVVLVLLAAVLALGLSSMASMESQMHDIESNHGVKTAAANEMVDNFRDIANANSMLVLLQDNAGLQEQKSRLAKARENYGRAKKTLTGFDLDEKEKQMLAKLDQKLAAAVPASNKVMELRTQEKFAEATEALVKISAPATGAAIAVIDEILTYEMEEASKAAREATAEYESAATRMSVLGALAILLGALAAWLITRSITRPINEAVTVAETVAAGDLTSCFEASAKDETGRLLQALKNMNENLVEIVLEVRSGTDAIASSSSEIASGNLDLSSRTEQQASSLEETASSMEELTSTVKQNAENARQANQLAISASAVASKGGTVVSEVVNTMASINESSKKIVDIIGVIDGIAFQTNILALNAAVEAARAGEQGRGFAVVASEVRNLAQRSAAAAKEIKTLIGDSVEKVDAGAKLVDQAGATMQEIVASITRVTDIMGEITAATHEQTSGIEQINQAISQMDQVTQQNASLVEEAAAASEAMQVQAGKLAQAVSVFKVDGQQITAAAPTAPARRAAHKKPGIKPVDEKSSSKGRNAIAAPHPRRAALPQAAASDEWEQF